MRSPHERSDTRRYSRDDEAFSRYSGIINYVGSVKWFTRIRNSVHLVQHSFR